MPPTTGNGRGQDTSGIEAVLNPISFDALNSVNVESSPSNKKNVIPISRNSSYNLHQFIKFKLYGTLTVYRQLGDSNSQWHKKVLQKVPVGEVPVGGRAS